jgi:hypothetical protein
MIYKQIYQVSAEKKRALEQIKELKIKLKINLDYSDEKLDEFKISIIFMG